MNGSSRVEDNMDGNSSVEDDLNGSISSRVEDDNYGQKVVEWRMIWMAAVG